MPNKIYDFMKANGLTTKDEATFLKEYSTPEKSRELHKFMMENELTTKDENSFYSEYFAPKGASSEVGAASGVDSNAPQQPSIPSGASPEYLNQLSEKNFVKRINNPSKFIQNADGSKSTHKMASAEVDGKQIAFPTIVEQNGKLVELPINEAIDFALKNNEFAEFAKAEDAQWYADGGYKKGTPLENFDSQNNNVPSGESLVDFADQIVQRNKQEGRDKFGRPTKLSFVENPDDIPYDVRTKALKGTSFESVAQIEPPVVGEKSAQVEAQVKKNERNNEKNQLKVASEKFVPTRSSQIDIKSIQSEFDNAYSNWEKTKENPQAVKDAEAKLNSALSELDKDYIDMYSNTPTRYVEMIDKYNKVTEKQSKGESLSDAEKEFLYDTRQSALGMKAAQDKARIMDIEDSVDINGYNKEVATLATMPISNEERAAKYAEIQQRTGVTDDVLNQLDSDYKGLAATQGASKVVDAQNRNIETERGLDQMRSEQRKEGSFMTTEAFKGLAGAMGSMTVGMGKLPKSMGIGDPTSYDWTDKLYDSSESIVKGSQGTWGALENAPTYLKYSYMLGQGVGSVAMFAAGGGGLGLAGVPSVAGTAGTAFILAQPENYTEALNSGMDDSDARIYSNVISAVEAAAEGIIPDSKYFTSQAKAGVLAAWKNTGSLKEALKAIPDLMVGITASGAKEGAEELTQQTGGDITKSFLDVAGGTEYYNSTWDANDYKEAFLSGALTGGFMKMFQSGQKKSPDTIEVMRDMIDSRESIVNNIAQYDPELSKQVDEVLSKAEEAKTGLEAHSKWDNLTTEAQNKALDLVWQMELAEDAKKKVEQFGIVDENRNKESERLAKELNDVFTDDANTKKYADTVITQLQQARAELGVEFDPMEDLPESVVTTFDRVDEGLPTDPVAVKEASDWLYSKYKQLSEMKNDDNRKLTIEQIEAIQTQLGEDIGKLENYRNENEQQQRTEEKAEPKTEATDGAITEAEKQQIREEIKISLPALTENGSGIDIGLSVNSKGTTIDKRRVPSYKKLGYTDEDIDNFSEKEAFEIYDKQIEKPVVESTAKIDLTEQKTEVIDAEQPQGKQTETTDSVPQSDTGGESDKTGVDDGMLDEGQDVKAGTEAKGEQATASNVESTAKAQMSDNDLQQVVGRDVFKQIQKLEEQLGEGVVDRNRMIETAKQIQKADKKDKLLPEHIFEALQYETGFPDNWQDLRNAIKKGGIDVNSEAVQRQIEVGVKLPKDIVEEFKKSERYKNANPELVEAVESLLSKEQTPALSDVVGKTFRDNYNRTFEVKGENAGILTLEDVDTGKVLRKKKSEVLSDFKEITEPDVVDMAKTITDHLPKGGELKGITEVKVSDNGEEVSYGTKTSKTSISVKGLSAEDIKQEIEFEKKVLAKSKRDVENFNEDEIRSAKGLTRQEKEDAIKMHKQSLINNEQTEKIVIPFYEKHLESLLSKEQATEEIVSKEPAKIDTKSEQVDQVDTKKDRGASSEVKFTSDKKVPVTYRLIEADELQPSHLSSGERNPMHQIASAQPKERNDAGSKMAQDKIANDPNIAEVGESPNAYFGAPIVNKRGEVIQGNNRSIGLKKHYRGNGKKYKADLEAMAEKFGFTKEQVAGMKNPILVREVDVNDQEAIELGQYDVKDLETGGKQRIDPIATSRKISPSDKAKIASIVFSGDFKTIKESIRANSKKVAEVLKAYLNPAQGKNTFNSDGSFTSQGMDDVSAVISNFLFDGGKAVLPEVFDKLPFTAKEGIQKALPYILSVSDNKSLKSHVQNAMLAFYEFNSSGQTNFDAWSNELDLFTGGSPKDAFLPIELAIAKKLIDAKSQNEIKDIFQKYEALTSDKPADMFNEAQEGMSKADAIKQQFNVEYNENEQRTDAKPQSEISGERVDSGKETKQTEKEEVTPFSKAASASSRFRPMETIVFEKPIVGPNGNSLVSYQWAYEWTMQPNREGELVDKRISDWTQAESSAETGRDVVHKFTVKRKDGTLVTVSSETVPSLLGYVDSKQMKNLPSIVSSVKTLAKQRMQLAILKAQEKEYLELFKKYSDAEKPEIKEIEEPVNFIGVQESYKEGKHNVYAMGDVWIRQDNEYDYSTQKRIKAKSPSKRTIEELTDNWIREQVKKDGGEMPRGLYDLQRRIERQEKKVEAATGSKIDTVETQPQKTEVVQTEPTAEEKPMSAARKKAEAARKKAEEIRNATGKELMLMPKLVAAALDLYATLLEKYDDITTALNEFKKSKEYTDLSDDDKLIVDQEIGDEETDKAEIDFKSAEGEEREGRRGKRISEDEKFREKLNGFSKTYKSINAEATTALVDAYYSQNVSGQENGGRNALEFAKELIIQDTTEGLANPDYVFSKSAFAVLLAQKVLSDAQLLGDIDLATEANNFLDLVGRSSGLKVALMQAKISLDALGSYAIAEAANQEKVGNETVSSGRKKRDVVKEIKEESDKAKAEAADEVSENLDVTDIVDNSKEAPKPQSKKASGKKAELEKKRKAAIDRVKKAFANKGVAGPLMAITPERAERIGAIKELAKVEIESGLYGLKEIIAKLAKDLNGVLSKKQISDVLIGEWNELAKIAEEAKRTESIELLKDAIENKVSDKALKALAKALKMADPEFIKTMNKGKRMNDAQIVEEILKDPQKAQDLLYAALGALIDDVNSGNHLDSVGVSKPKNMSDEEWDAVRKKYVINKFKQFVDTLIPLADEKSVSMADQKQKQEEESLEQAWLKAKERRDKAKANAEKRYEDREKEKLAKKEEADAEKALREVEKAYEKDAREKENWIKAKDRFEKAKANAEKRYEDREKEKLAKKEEADAEKALREVEKAYEKDAREKENWIKAKDRFEKAKANAEKKQADKEAEKLAEAQLEAREKELAEAERLWNNFINQKVKEVVSKFYKNPNSNQTFVEALIEAIPSLSVQQAIQIAEKVQTQINKKLDQRDNKRIKELINEMTDGREDSSVNEVMQKIFFNRGAISQFGFTNMLSKYLGYKGLPQYAIAQITQLAQQAARMKAGALRTQIMNQANTIAASYSNTAWQNLYEILTETLVRNLLSKVKTAFTGGFSVSFFAIPNAIKKTLINRPANTIRALKFTGKNLYNGRWGVRNAFMESMYRHNDPFAQATERADNIYSKDRAWQRARKATFSEIKKLWGVDKGRAASMIAGRALIEGTFQGKLPITNIIPDAMAFMNYIAYKFMQDMNLAYMAQDKTIMEGIKPSDPKFKDEFLKKLSMTPAQLKSIETAVDNEIAQAVSQGVPVPKGFRKDRIREMIAQNTDEMLFQRAMEQSVYDIGMNNPKSALGAFAYGNLRKLKFKPQVEGQLSFLGMSINLLSTTLGLFSRQAIVLGERAAQYAPILGTAAYLYPKRFDYKDNKLVVLKDDKDEAYNMYKSDPKEAAYRISVSVAVLGLAAYILANWWDDEEIIDPATGEKVVDPETGKPLTRQRYLMGGKVDFFGSSPKIRREDRGIDPTNTMRVYSDDGTFRDVPFEAMGQMYAFVMGLGQLRDKQRYGVEKVVLDADKLKDPTTIKAELQQSAEIDWASLATASAANAANTDFQTVSKIVKVLQAREKADIPAGLFDVLVINPAKGTVNPAVVRSLQEQYYNMSDRYKTYIKLESDVQNLGTYLAKDVWFLDPWIENRKDYESVDIFGNKIAYPPIYNDFLGSFGSTTNYVMANHVEEHKDMYSLFMVDGKYIPYPARYIYRPSKFDMAGMDKSVKVEDNLQRMISDKTYENFGVVVKQNMDLIKSVTDYDQRRELLDNMFDFASYQAVLFAFPNSQRKPSDTEVEKTPQEKEAMNSFIISNLPK